MKSICLVNAFFALLVFVSPSVAAERRAEPKTATGNAEEPAQKSTPPQAKTASPYADPATVTAAMKKAVSFLRRDVSFAGGYAWKWPRDMSTAKGEDHASPTLIMMQPPGTPAMGLVMLDAYKASGDPLFLQGAKEAAQALMWCQLASGGWDSDYDFDPRMSRHYHFRRDIEAGDTERAGRHADSTLDDDKTQSALLFLLELAHTDACKDDVPLHAALKFGFDGLLAAQAPNGGWGQHYEAADHAGAPVTKAVIPAEWPHVWPGKNYTRYYTLNDNNLRNVMHLLLRAHELERDERFLTAARKLGDFLLLAQLPEPQPAWAQQYDAEMTPVWARKFEPPAVCSVESEGAIQALIELWLATGEKKFVETLPAAIGWLERMKLADGRWARFYELGTDKPLYCKANTYEVTFDDSDLPTHYGFKVDAEFGKKLTALKAVLGTRREQLIAKQQAPTDPKKWANRAKAAAARVGVALKTQEKNGAWLKDDFIDADEFVKNLKAMSAYVDAAKKGNEAFEAMRQATPKE